MEENYVFVAQIVLALTLQATLSEQLGVFYMWNNNNEVRW